MPLLLFLVAAFVAAFTASAHAREVSDLPVVKLQSLDKITARTQTFEANVGSTVKFGPLFIKVRACRKAAPVEQPESGSFLQIWEVTKDDQAEWIFSGWMFASSPGLSHMDHPIYDVWVLDCLERKQGEAVAAAEGEVTEGHREGEGELANDEAPVQPELADDAVQVDMPEQEILPQQNMPYPKDESTDTLNRGPGEPVSSPQIMEREEIDVEVLE